MALLPEERPKPQYPHNWKAFFLDEPVNSWLCDIPDDFIVDDFNLYGLNEKFEYFNLCRYVIIGKKSLENLPPKKAYKLFHDELPKAYGLIHARYIMSPNGIKQMEEKYQSKKFGTCPRINCCGQALLPYGESSNLDYGTVKGLCPRCRQLYRPRPNQILDGAYFGPNAAHIIIDDDPDIKCSSLYYKPYNLESCGFKVYDPRKLPQ